MHPFYRYDRMPHFKEVASKTREFANITDAADYVWDIFKYTDGNTYPGRLKSYYKVFIELLGNDGVENYVYSKWPDLHTLARNNVAVCAMESDLVSPQFAMTLFESEHSIAQDRFQLICSCLNSGRKMSSPISVLVKRIGSPMDDIKTYERDFGDRAEAIAKHKDQYITEWKIRLETRDWREVG